MDLYQVHKNKRAKLVRIRTVRGLIVVACMAGVVLASREFNMPFVLLTVVAAAIVADMADPLERQQFKLKKLADGFSRCGMRAEEVQRTLCQLRPNETLMMLTGSIGVTALGVVGLSSGNDARSSSAFAMFLGLFWSLGTLKRVIEWRLWAGRWRLTDYL